MNFMKTIRALNYKNITESLLLDFKKTLDNRLIWLQLREPESSGSVYETWEEKTSELEDCISIIEDTIRTLSENSLDNNSEEDLLNLRTELADEIVETIELYNIMWGGLTRLKIE